MPAPGPFSLFRPRVLDERGRAVRVRHVKRAWRRASWSWHGRHWKFWAIFAASMGAMVLLMWGHNEWFRRDMERRLEQMRAAPWSGPPSMFHLPMLVQPIVIFATMFPLGWGFQKACLPDLAQLTVDEGTCPSCAYDLKGLSAGEDGCAACPECGSVWRIAGTNNPPCPGRS